MVTVEVLGSGREVGRAAIAIRSKSGRAFLFDYGVNFTENDEPVFPEHIRPADLAGIVLTHSHLDHVGAAPLLYVSVKPRLFATPLTLDISRILYNDMIKLSGDKLMFDQTTVNEMLSVAEPLTYGKEVEIEDFLFKLLYSGHIPGSASVYIEVDGKRILYTSDMNVLETKLVGPADFSGVDPEVVIIESTYGATLHPSRRKTEERLYETIREIVESGGIALIPAFSVSRGQEVMCVLAEKDPSFPIWVDGMIRDVAEIYLKHKGYVRMEGLIAKSMVDFNIVRGWQDRRRALREPGAIIASSGMLKGGPSLHYLKKLGENPNNAVILVSYQGRGTPGRQMLETGFVLSEERPVRARVYWFDLSSHVDQQGILNTLRSFKNLEKVVLVHGTPSAQEVLAKKIENELDVKTLIPGVGEKIEI
ncbi:MAG: MBL fold metallo-hydrolase [Acidilobaceae archaeon]